MAARILIVEDNPANLELMRYLLEAYRYEAIAAVDGAHGIATAASERPDLILCDIQLPDMDGYEVLRRIRGHASSAGIPIVAVTALAMVGDRDKVLAAGFDGYLSKPIDPETFVRHVEAFLAVRLRSVHPRPMAASTEAPVGAAGTGRTILAIDNLESNLDLVASLFGNLGYRVVTTSDAAGLLALARQVRPDLILCDVCMPDTNGYEVIAAVKADEMLHSIPFVFLTSTMTNESDRRKGLALGAARFLFRPIEPDVLLAEIRDCLGDDAG